MRRINFIYYDVNSYKLEYHEREIVYSIAYKDLNEIANSICKNLKSSGNFSYVSYDILNDICFSESNLIDEATVLISYHTWNINNY